ncbi:phospholipase A2 group V isoform X3 [Cavia porcellus]|uniref:phospholipase A2 group V isoform X3 n=1 Tax=Cavia porcellus TaxID=10141 RepID=UPI002FE1BAA5
MWTGCRACGYKLFLASLSPGTGLRRRIQGQATESPRDERLPHIGLAPGLQCCWMHDRCYGKLEEEGCDIRAQYYTYRVRRGLVTCDIGSLCPMQLCSCDQKLAYCLKRNLWSYNPNYQYFPNIFCY